MKDAGHLLGALVASVLGLALVSVVISRNAATAQVIGAGSSGLATLISAATAPVTGSSPVASGGISSGGGGIGGFNPTSFTPSFLSGMGLGNLSSLMNFGGGSGGGILA